MPINNKPAETDFLSRQAEQANRNSKEIDTLHKKNSVGPWIPATLLNNYTNAGSPYADVAYRLVGDEVQIRGHMDVSNAVSGTLAFTIIASHRPAHDVTFLTDMQVNTNTFVTVRVTISTNGQVRLYWT